MGLIAKIKKELKGIISFWKISPEYQLVNCPPYFTEDGRNLQFRVDYFVQKDIPVHLVGQIPSHFLGEWGQIGDEREDEYILSVFENSSDLLARITVELYKNSASDYLDNKSGYPLINVTKEALHTHNMFVD